MSDAPPPLEMIIDGPADAAVTIALAHGAGAPFDSPFMNAISEGLARHGRGVVRFEFPYMRRSRRDGRRRPPDRAAALQKTWVEVAARLGDGPLVVGGKSMGGRIATQVADSLGVRGVICLGFPFHPPGKPERLRLEDLSRIATPTLIVQGTRDALGSAGEVTGYALSARVRVHWIPDGDHSFVPRKSSGRTTADNLKAAVNAIEAFVATL